MTAIINTKIPASSFEVIRTMIAAVLGIELRKQYELDSTIPNIGTNVFVERFITINSETEIPAINISIANATYDNETHLKAEETITYNIDIYTSAPTSEATGPGDQYAMAQMTRLVGIVRNILAYSGYYEVGNILLLDSMIQESQITKFFIADKSAIKDALSDVVGRMQFRVITTENNVVSDQNASLAESFTTIKLSESDNGFYFDYADFITNEAGNIITTETGENLTAETIS